MIQTYYDQLAPYYRLLYPDWERSMARQAAALDKINRAYLEQGPCQVLDAACGIGTQSLGLARLGYSVTASDISEAELALARQEAERRGLATTFCQADMRQLWAAHQRQFDLVIACDNAVPHLLTEADIGQAFAQFYRCLRPGGGCLISVRDYAAMALAETSHFYPRLVRETAQGRQILFDVWQVEGDYYDLTTYLMEDQGQPTAQTQVIRGGRYYCVTLSTLEKLLRQAGFSQVETLPDAFFQPLIVSRRP